MKKFRQIGLLLSALVGMMGVASCTDFHEDYGEGGFAGGDVPVTFTVSVPGVVQTVGKTYAMTDTAENAVVNIQALIFQEHNGDTLYLGRRSVQSVEISTPGSDISKKSFTINLPESDEKYLVVLIANAEILVETTLVNNLTGQTKTFVLSYLRKRAIGKQNAYEGSTIPMWGETDLFSVPDPSGIEKKTVDLVRMVAKVSVLVSKNAPGENFKLQSVYVYNAYDMGYVAGGMPTLVPPGAIKQTSPIEYYGPEVKESGCENEIYLFEANNSGPMMAMENRTCLVLRAKYKSEPNDYYYRVDFLKKDTFIDILRNHHYKVVVNKITGIGYTTPEEALAKRPFNIDAMVIEWNDTDKNIKNLFTDGRYMLGLSSVGYDLDGGEYGIADFDNQLIIKTDHPDGWQIVSIIDSDTQTEIDRQTGWLRKSDPSELPEYSLVHLLTQENDTYAPRSATIKVRAGTIEAEVKVTQGERQPGRLVITNSTGPLKEITELVFAGNAPAAQEFRVTWSPKDAECTIDTIRHFKNLGPLTYASGSDRLGVPGPGGMTVTSAGAPGTQVFTVRPDNSLPVGDADEYSTLVVFTLPTASHPSKSILLRYIKRYYLESDNLTVYSAEEQSTFNIVSNATWTIKSITNGDLIEIENWPRSGGIESARTTMPFTFTPKAGASGVVSIVFVFNGTEQTVPFRITPTVYYVSAGGDDANDGITPATPLATMQRALTSIQTKITNSEWPLKADGTKKPATIVVSGTIENDGTGAGGNMMNITGTLPYIKLDGSGTLDAMHLGSVININHGDTVSLEGNLILRGGNKPSGTPRGGGVFVQSGSNAFIMNGGTIEDCYAAAGGGVCAEGYFEMNDGTIRGDSAEWGGGVFVAGTGTFEMKGGTISTNKAIQLATPSSGSGCGGGVYLQSGGTFVMSGEAKIYGVKKFDSNDAENAVDGAIALKNIAKISGSSLFNAGGTATYAGYPTPTGFSGNIIASGYSFTHHTLPSAIKVPEPVWYVYEGGNDNADGRSVETAVKTPQTALDAPTYGIKNVPSLTEATILVSDTIKATGGGPLVNISGSAGVYPSITLQSASSAEWPDNKDGVLSANDIASGYVLYVVNHTVTLDNNLTLMGGNNAAPTGYAGGANVGGSSGKLILNEASIIGNKGFLGGGVYVFNSGTFTMNNGGTITENTAMHGGGVYVANSGTFTMTGGEIGGGSGPNRGNVADYSGGPGIGYGGGVYVHAAGGNKGKFDKTGGIVYGFNGSGPPFPYDNNLAYATQGCAVWDYTTVPNYRDTTLDTGDDWHSN
ncbi:hypothetical protein AGMMS4957_17520 [Bacteroidia bacterium]|nr:hypothetical protein AGMMS4957_17520 [Bacteroidia bacterium]